MESPSSPPSGRPDALDPFEERAARLLDLDRGEDSAAWDALLVALAQVDRDEPDRKLYPDPPPIDPSEGRRSSCELRRLIDAVRGVAVPQPPPARTRAGYALNAPPDGVPRVMPAFVAALDAATDLQGTFPDLWIVDFAIWELLDNAELSTLARVWLESPGRRLIHDLGALRHVPGKLGASDLSLVRLVKAAGIVALFPHRGPATPAWRELHLAVPGDGLVTWQPHADGEPVVRALRLLEEGSPFGLRGAALAWLLNRAADDPFYAVQGIRRDLREDLPVRLGTALSTWFGDDREASVARELETLALQHAARIFADEASDDTVWRAWSVARWLQRCLSLSPFFGGDEEALAAHLRSLLPREPIAVPRGADALHPARFTLDGSGLDVAEIAFLAGVLAHYGREPSRTLLPTPVPVVNALQAIARRTVRSAEDAADAAGHHALGWAEGYPIAAPLAARKLMTELRIGWVAHVGADAQVDAIERFGIDPRGQAGVAFAFHREAQHLGPRSLQRAAGVFRALHQSGAAEPNVLATFGVSILPALDDAAVEQILALARAGDSAWRPFVADALAGAAERLAKPAVWAASMAFLLTLMADADLDPKIRLNAALFALRRASVSKLAEREGFLGRIGVIASAPPFSEHLGLRREVRRLGLGAPAAAAGGKR